VYSSLALVYNRLVDAVLDSDQRLQQDHVLGGFSHPWFLVTRFLRAMNGVLVDMSIFSLTVSAPISGGGAFLCVHMLGLKHAFLQFTSAEEA